MLSHLELNVPIELTTVAGAGTLVHQGRSDVVDDVIALGGNNLERLNVAVLGEARINQNVRPPVGPVGLHDHVFRQTYNEIRLADLPGLIIRELARRRHVRGISLESTAVHPLDDRGDFFIGQRLVVIEVLHSNVPINEPRRHFPSGDSLLDRPRPRTRLFVSHQRHGRNRAHMVTILAMLLEDRRNVLREGNLILRQRCCRNQCNCCKVHQRAKGDLHSRLDLLTLALA